MTLYHKIRAFPSSPGVYLMRDADGNIIYIGKARNLHQRIRSYFGASGDSRYHVKFLMARVEDIDFILTDTEKEALLLENSLIKQYQPRYNLNLKDDKTYFSLRLDPREEFPRFTVVRKVPRDGACYYGPYASPSAAREVLRQIARMFPLRHYPLTFCMTRRRPCLYHQIGQCSAPCHGLISSADYAVLVKGATLFLEGKNRELVLEFRRRMAEAAETQQYEEAARWRDLVRAVGLTLERQKMVTRGGDSDVIGFHRDGVRLELALLFIRGGVLLGSRSFLLSWELDDAEGVASFLRQYYSGDAFIPEEIILPLEIEDQAALSELLSDVKGSKVVIILPRRGVKKELTVLASRNAAAALSEKVTGEEKLESVLKELQHKLHLTRLPRRIECYDISTIQGLFSVGSCAAFTDGRSDKGLYRRYRIRGVAGQDDFAMLQEVFSRRFRSASEQKDGLPDLVVVDGGIGQLNSVLEIISKLGLAGSMDVISLAKSRVARDRGDEKFLRSAERIFLPARKNPVVLRQNSPSLLLLTLIRDEAHRFAITYHRTLRSKAGTVSAIEDIPGIGVKRRTTLLKAFGSIEGLRRATLEEIAAINGMSRSAATRLHEWLLDKPA